MAQFLDKAGVTQLWNATKTKVDAEATARQNADDEIINMIFNTHGNFTNSCSPSVIEKGVSTNVVVNTGVTFNGKALTHTVEVDGAAKATNYPLTDSHTFQIKYSINNADPKIVTTVNKTATVNAYYPKYYGGSTKTAITAADVTTLTKQGISGSASGTVNITSAANEYIWFCVPENMTIKDIKLGGFAVPFQSAITLAVSGKGNYKCYRTQNPLSAGTRSFVIS